MKRALVIALCGCCLGAASVAQSPADQPAFEVASVKHSNPNVTGRPSNDCHGGPGSSDPGLLTCTNAALAQLIITAYNLQFYELVSPEWAMQGGSANGYDVVAKIPAGTTTDQYRLMLQKLLADRFHLVVHRENKELSTYVLMLGKGRPTLQPSAVPPAAGPPFDMKMIDGHVQISTHNRSVTAFAGSLSGFLSAPVTDETGLNGNYDITLEFMPDDRWRGFPYLPAPHTAAAGDAVPDLSRAIQDQLGLKLDRRKGPISVLVVDRADKTPVEN